MLLLSLGRQLLTISERGFGTPTLFGFAYTLIIGTTTKRGFCDWLRNLHKSLEKTVTEVDEDGDDGEDGEDSEGSDGSSDDEDEHDDDDDDDDEHDEDDDDDDDGGGGGGGGCGTGGRGGRGGGGFAGGGSGGGFVLSLTPSSHTPRPLSISPAPRPAPCAIARARMPAPHGGVSSPPRATDSPLLPLCCQWERRAEQGHQCLLWTPPLWRLHPASPDPEYTWRSPCTACSHRHRLPTRPSEELLFGQLFAPRFQKPKRPSSP